METQHKNDLINEYILLTDDIEKTRNKIKIINEFLDNQNKKLKELEKDIFKIILNEHSP
jgi:hypothetical protein